MKKYVFGTLITTILVVFAFSGMANAGYDPSKDIRIYITLPFMPPHLSEKTAKESFERQEAIHAKLREKGIDLDYYYIWININGIDVLAIDPPKLTITPGTTDE